MTMIDTIVEWSRPFDDASKAGIDYRPAAMPDGVLDPACRVGVMKGCPGEIRVYLTASRSDLPALKEGAFEAAMVMLSPVRGLCP